MDLLKSLAYPEEICALVKYKLCGGGSSSPTRAQEASLMSSGMRICYEYLNRTSRSFAAVIQALDPELRDAVCIFYLVLRALDTVEDDVTISSELKLKMLREFHTYVLDPDWKYMDSKEKDRIVLEDFPVISAEFRALRPEYKDVITDICRQMGSGMIVYYLQSPDTVDQWDEYCHYVAGLVGIGLSRLFAASKLENETVSADTKLANSMGLFLQKTNIIRDYLEDVQLGRNFWPKQVWSKYASSLTELGVIERRDAAVSCLNELIINALGHVPDVLTYLALIRNQSIFNFCAIPQVMAIATLERCYNNTQVFSGVVKIRKGETLCLMSSATNINTVKAIFSHFVSQIKDRASSTDQLSATSQQCLQLALSVSCTSQKYITRSLYMPLYVSAAMLLAAIVWQCCVSMMYILTGVDNSP